MANQKPRSDARSSTARSGSPHPPATRKPDDDRALARKIQQAMVPLPLPAVEGIDCAAMYVPGTTVGGDGFNVEWITNEIMVFYLYDVAEYGVGATLISTFANQSFLRHIRGCTSADVVMERVNADMLSCFSAEHFCTAFLACIDLHDNRISYANAGHPCPVLVRKERGTLEELSAQGFILGAFPDGRYEERSVYLEPGDMVCAFTNGIFDVLGTRDEQQGRGRLNELLSHNAFTVSPDRIIEELTSKHAARVPQGSIDDDCAALALEIVTQSRKNRVKELLGFTKNDHVYVQYLRYFEEIDSAAASVLQAMDAMGYRDEDIRRMKIVLTELLANGIGHGNREDYSKKVTMGHLVDKDVASIAVMDEGEGFDPDSVSDPTLPENLVKDRGRGIFIVRNYVDEMTYNEKGNRVLIRKNHHLAKKKPG